MSEYSLDAPRVLAHKCTDTVFEQMVAGYTNPQDPSVANDAAEACASLLGLEEAPILDPFTYVVVQAMFYACMRYAQHINLPNKPQ